MKSTSVGHAVLTFMCFVLLAAAPVFAKEWSASQKEVLNSFNTYLADVQQGNLKSMLAYWHPKYVSQNYAQELPTDYDASAKGLEEFIAKGNAIVGTRNHHFGQKGKQVVNDWIGLD